MLEVAGSLQVSSIIPLQTDRNRNKINFGLNSSLFFIPLSTPHPAYNLITKEPK
jgi:hypothetical protein